MTISFSKPQTLQKYILKYNKITLIEDNLGAKELRKSRFVNAFLKSDICKISCGIRPLKIIFVKGLITLSLKLCEIRIFCGCLLLLEKMKIHPP